LAVENLSEGNYNPDLDFETGPYGSWELDGEYTFSVTPCVTLSELSAAELAQGAKGTLLRLTGNGFQEGSALAASFGGSGVEVTSVSVLATTKIDLTVTVDTKAAKGTRDLTFTNGDGTVATLTGALTIVGGSSSSGCSTAGATSGAWFLLLWPVVRWRRRSASRPR
jgi:hypothetical protein